MDESSKLCPYCGEEIAASAKKCRYCGEWLEDCAANEQGELAYAQQEMANSTFSEGETYSETVAEEGYVENPFVNTDRRDNDVTYLDGEWFDDDGKLIGWDERHPQSLLRAYGYFPFFKMDYIFNFTTPISSKAYWWSYLYSMIWLLLVLTFLDLFECLGGNVNNLIGFKNTAQFKTTIALIVGGIMAIGFLIGTVSAMSRRLVDTGRSPWLVLLGLIPAAGPIILLVLLLQKGTVTKEFNPGKFNPKVDVTAFVLILASLGIMHYFIPDEFYDDLDDGEEMVAYDDDDDDEELAELVDDEDESYASTSSSEAAINDLDFDFTGTVANYNVKGHLYGDEDGSLKGFYYYLKNDGSRKSENMMLDGDFDDTTGEFIIDEYYDDELIGQFEGQYYKGYYSGTYTNLNTGKTMDFSFTGL